MNQHPWPFPEYDPNLIIPGDQGDESAEGRQDNVIGNNQAVVDDGSSNLWYPQTSWDLSDPSSAYHHPSLQTHPNDLDPHIPQPISSKTSSEYSSSIYTPTGLGGGGFEDRSSSSRLNQFSYTGEPDSNSMDSSTGGEMRSQPQSGGPLLDPRRHHHFMRGRSADEVNIESASSAERRRAQNRNSQRSFRKRKEERLQELEIRVTELETQIQALNERSEDISERNKGLEKRNQELEERNRVLEERNRVLEARNGEVEGWNRELVGRVEGLREEVVGLRGRR